MQIRLRKDGGYSECNAPDELVGKGRCIHVLEGPCGEQAEILDINRVGRGMYQVEIPEDVFDEVEAKEDVLSYIQQLPKISKAKEKRIIAALNSL